MPEKNINVSGNALGEAKPDEKTDAVSYQKTVENKAAINDIRSYIGYSENDIIGIDANFSRKEYKKLIDGLDFHIQMLPGVKKCNVDENYQITAIEGDANYTEGGTVLYRVPKFYYRYVGTKFADLGSYGYAIHEANYYISAEKKGHFTTHEYFYDIDGNEIPFILADLDGKIYDPYFRRFCANNAETGLYKRLRENAHWVKRYKFQPPYYNGMIMGDVATVEELPLPTDPDESLRPHIGFIYCVGPYGPEGNKEFHLHWWNGKKWEEYWLPEPEDVEIDINAEIEEIKALLNSGQEIPERDREILEGFLANNQAT